jgi:hypothetical protein
MIGVSCDTYAAPVPLALPVPLRYLSSNLSLDGITMPTQSAPPMKKNMRRHTNEEKARFMSLRGFSASAAAMEMNSGPTILRRIVSTNLKHLKKWKKREK